MTAARRRTLAAMEYRIVNPAGWIARAEPLMRANWAETGFDFDFAPDVDAYQRMHDAGLAFAIAALDGEDLIGYCTVVVAPHPHNQRVVVAGNDALFVVPERRGGPVALRIIQAAEAEAARRGAVRFAWHTRAGTPLALVLQRRGYRPADVVVVKEISRGP